MYSQQLKCDTDVIGAKNHQSVHKNSPKRPKYGSLSLSQCHQGLGKVNVVEAKKIDVHIVEAIITQQKNKNQARAP